MLLLLAFACAPPDTSSDKSNVGDTTVDTADTATATAPDTATDTAPDTATDTAPDTATDTAADTASDTATDTAPDAESAPAHARLFLRDDGEDCTDLEREHGDADGDGTIDLVVGCDDRVLLVPAEGEGERGVVASAVGSLRLGADERYAAAGDPTGDGVLDLLILDEPGGYTEDGEWRADLTVLRVPGPWSPDRTSTAADLSVTTASENVASVGAIPGDVDGDGVDDVVYTPGNTGGSVVTFLPAGGSSGDGGTVTAADPLQQIAAAGDLDGDGARDLVVVVDDGIAVVSGPVTGARAYDDSDVFVFATDVVEVAAAGDVDADGRDELIVRTAADETMRLLRGPISSGSLRGASTVTTVQGRDRDVYVTAELDGDEGRELLVGAADVHPDGVGASAVYVFLDPGVGVWTVGAADRAWQDAPDTRFGTAVTALPDLDGDGADDVAVRSELGVYVFPWL